MIATDASSILVLLVDDTVVGARTRMRFDGQDLVAPEIVDLEVAQALHRLVRRGELAAERGSLLLAELSAMPIRRFPHRPLLSRCWELRDNLTVYDAAYVALAESLGVTLVTGDKRLARSPGIGCEIEVLR